MKKCTLRQKRVVRKTVFVRDALVREDSHALGCSEVKNAPTRQRTMVELSGYWPFSVVENDRQTHNSWNSNGVMVVPSNVVEI